MTLVELPKLSAHKVPHGSFLIGKIGLMYSFDELTLNSNSKYSTYVSCYYYLPCFIFFQRICSTLQPCRRYPAGSAISPEEEKASLEEQLASLDLYATMYGYGNADQYLKTMYGNGASKKTYTAYCEKQALASAYYGHYADSLTYDDAALREAEAARVLQIILTGSRQSS